MIQVQPDDEVILILEQKLQNSLYKVKPNPAFIDQLGRRLTTPAGVVIEQPRRTTGFLIISLGLLIGLILVWLLFPKKD
mgnify:CR=1 FL=1